MKKKVLITTVPFAEKNKLPLELLDESNIEYVINPLGKKLTENELCDMVADFDAIIAGTEPVTRKVMERAENLKMISRVGIGLDSVDLLAAIDHNIKVSYTPDAPSSAVSELTVGLLITLLRSVHTSNIQMHQGLWKRYFGKRIANITIGIIGVGRIGRDVLDILLLMNPKRILLNDIDDSIDIKLSDNVVWTDKETIYNESDAVTIHVPLTSSTKNMITREHLKLMKSDSVIINTSRGGIINEKDLYDILSASCIGSAAIDVFEEEPYCGLLNTLDNCLLTAHMGSMSEDCRTRMEIEATEEAVRFLTNKQLRSEVPDEEIDVQREGL